MTTKQTILEGERLLQLQNDFLRRINTVSVLFDVKEALLILLAIEKTKIHERAATIEKRLAELGKKHLVEFEKLSAEANMKMADTCKNAGNYVDREPKGIADRVKAIIGFYEENPHMEQDEMNDLYTELNGHINFLKK